MSLNYDLLLGLLFGMAFGFLLQRSRVTYYDVIVNMFRLKDFTVLKVMLSAIIVGGVGIMVFSGLDMVSYHIKAADLLAVAGGATIFGIGMVLYGYCPGTGIAAVGQGSLHALVGLAGMLVGGMLYAWSFPWVKEHILPVAALGKIRLPDITPLSDLAWFSLLIAGAAVLIYAIEKFTVNED